MLMSTNGIRDSMANLAGMVMSLHFGHESSLHISLS